MLSKNKIKEINALTLKKNRDNEGLFIAEGTKIVLELLSRFKCHSLIATEKWLLANSNISTSISTATEDELKKISQLKTPQGVLAVFHKPKQDFEANSIRSELSLALDDIQDPGNLGTIIRIADWFGIKNIFCSQQTADAFSPKTVQATMGSIARVNIIYTDLAALLSEQKALGTPIYGTFLNGENIYSKYLSSKGIIVMGNEGNGISATLEASIEERLYIPHFSVEGNHSESLNVGVATAIICSEFRRR